MIGKSVIVWTGLAIIASGILFHTSYRVQEQSAHLSAMRQKIQREQETIQVLQAEWAYLNDPARLERLASEYTVLRPATADQLVDISALPAKPETAVLMAAMPIPAVKPGSRLAGQAQAGSQVAR